MKPFFSLALVFVLAGCSGPATVGATPLGGAEHMRSYLVQQSDWRAILDDGEELLWSFSDDGTCQAWIEGEGRADLHFALSRIVPEGTRRIDARWTADTERLQLTDVTHWKADPLRDMGFPLGWVDGKLRIEIAGRRFMKRLD
jgi:hypothetical protein